jgi:lysozyme
MNRNNSKTALRSRRKQKKKSLLLLILESRFFIITAVLVLVFSFGYHYRKGLSHYLGFISHKMNSTEVKAKRISDVRNFQVLESHKGKSIGLDVSEFQGKIDWKLTKKIEKDYDLDFVFIRATAGMDKVDRKFNYNWLEAKNNNLIRGAYHYYRPNENSIDQANFFIKTVQLHKGDLPPVLDIEKLPKNQSMKNLKLGLNRWLKTVEAHYKVKPIIYTGEKYYKDFLKDDFKDYLFWIANYNFYREKIGDDWLFWQFTEKATVSGIKGNVDVNIYNGDLEQLRFITIE